MKRFILLLCTVPVLAIHGEQLEPVPLTSKHSITIIGTGYVGLVTGACLAAFGNYITCADIDTAKINKLRSGIIPIFEPGLESLVKKNVDEGRLCFTYDVGFAIRSSSILFIAVGTPCEKNGSANLCGFDQVIETIVQNLNNYKVIVIKSTVPIGTCKDLKERLIKKYKLKEHQFDIVSNPEFLREGKAVDDFFNPDRLIIGAPEKLIPLMKSIYEPLIQKQIPAVFADVTETEAIKYVSNSFLGLKISFINEIANLCDRIGIDALTVADGVGLDNRINRHFFAPSPGFGGSCFPKDIKALLRTAQEYGIGLHTVQAALTANEMQYHKPVEKLLKLIPTIKDKTIAVLGLAFKANTDDVRDSSAIKTIQSLLDHQVHIKAYDPEATKNMRVLFPDITYCTSLYEAVTGADAAIIMTEWDEFKCMDLVQVKSLMRQHYIIDARNILSPAQLQELGFIAESIGRSCLYCKAA